MVVVVGFYGFCVVGRSVGRSYIVITEAIRYDRKFLTARGANTQEAATNLLYNVNLTPPAASAGRASIDAFGLGGAGGAIVIGT